MHHWDIARAAKIVGMQTTMNLDPTKITVRIKNRLIRWLEKGEYVGGWSSKSRRVAEVLAKEFDLPQALRTWEGIRVRYPTPELRKEMMDLVRADWTLALIDYPGYNKSWARNRFDSVMKELESGECGDCYIGMHNHEFTKQAFALLDKHQRDQYSANVKACVDALNGTALIHVTTLEN